MGNVQRSGRVGRDIFDIDRPAAAGIRGAITAPGGQHVGNARLPETVGDLQIDEAGSGDLHAGHLVHIGKPLGQALGDCARRQARGLGQHHGGVGRDIAMACLARRLRRHPRCIEPGRQAARCNQRLDLGDDLLADIGEGVHLAYPFL